MFFFKKKKATSDNQSILKNTRESLKAIDEKAFGKEAQEKILRSCEEAKKSLVENYHRPDILKHILPAEADNAEGRRQAKQGQLHPEEWSETGRLQAATRIIFNLYSEHEVTAFYGFSDMAHRLAFMLKDHGVSETEFPIEGIEWYNFLSAAKAIYKTLEHEFAKLPDFTGKKIGEYCLSAMNACIEVMELNEKESSIYQIPDLLKMHGINTTVYAHTVDNEDEVTALPVTIYMLNGTKDINMIIDWMDVGFAQKNRKAGSFDATLVNKYGLKEIYVSLLLDKTKKANELFNEIHNSDSKR